MKSKLKALAIILGVSLIGGCAAKSNEESSQTVSESVPAAVSSVTPEVSSAPAESVPMGEPTFLIGLDGKAILTSEITRLECTDKTVETLTEDDLYADIYCEGFTYVKLPLDEGYDNYHNPEMFDGYKFIGEAPVNKNEWRRVSVGDEICGLKVKSATAYFCVNDWRDVPERHYSPQFSNVELEGSVEMEGFLQVTARSVNYPEIGETVWFYPVKNKLPIMPYINFNNETKFDVPFESHWIFDVSDLRYAGEGVDGAFGRLNDMVCDMDGLGVGDVAYARVTISGITLTSGAFAGTLESVELLSDILAHSADQTELHQPAPVKD